MAMIMNCINEVIQILSPSWLPVAKHVGYVVELEDNIDSLTVAMSNLLSVTDDVKRKADVAELQPEFKRTSYVQSWLEKIEAAEGEVRAMSEAFQKMSSCICNIRSNFWSGYWLSKSAAMKLEDLVKLKDQGLSISFDVVADKTLPDAAKEMPSSATLGMELMLQNVLRLLGEDDVGVVGIHGMGGVGKTTLLNRINNEYARKPGEIFTVVIFTVVSKEANIAKIQKDIADRLGLRWDENDDSKERRAQDIFNKLSRMKFLLFLDDLWARLDLEVVGIPYPDIRNKSKVVFTTRSEDVCARMDADRKVKVECLPEKEAWDLFQKKVGEEAMKSHLAIPALAKLVAKECGGLPLALTAIGRAMSTKKTPQEWKHAITTLSTANPPSEISGMDDEFFMRLKFSYDNLQGETVKSCFLYCSLFPEDHSIDIEGLIDYWVGEGFLDKWYGDLDAARNKGHDIIRSLKVACLLESGSDGQTQVKMHDLIRDMALWIASDRFLVKANCGLREAPKAEKWKEAKRVSLMENEIEKLPVILPTTCPNLSTLLLLSNAPLKITVSDFFHSIPLLKVLDLSNCKLIGIPDWIGCLVNLQYLNLSNTFIPSLPKEIGNLKRLRHLDLGESSCKIPRGVIPMLSSLKILKMPVRYSEKAGMRNAFFISGSFFIEELEDLEDLTSLYMSITQVSVLNSLVGSHKVSMLIQKLQIKDCLDHTRASAYLSTILRVMRNLKHLELSSVETSKQLTISEEGVNDNGFVPSLETLELLAVSNLNTVCFRNCWYFQNLRVIIIWACCGLKSIEGLTQLKYLEKLEVWLCYEIERLICDSGVEVEGNDQQGLTSLKHLVLDDLCDLTHVCDYSLAFPSLETVKVTRCPKLKKLPLGLQSSSTTLGEDQISVSDCPMLNNFPLRLQSSINNTLTPFQIALANLELLVENQRLASREI